MESIYGQLNTEARWYALHTRNRHEKKVNARLEQKKITSYLPLHTIVRYWSDRKKKVTEPLFNCYVFVKIALKDRMPVLQTDGAVKLVTFNNVPVPIPENQIEAVRRLLAEKVAVELTDRWVPGQRVRITRGPLQGIEGILQQKKGKSRLVIAIDGIKQAVSAEVDGDLIEIMERHN